MLKYLKWKKQEKGNEKLLRKLQKNLQEAKEDKSSVEYTNQCLISEINRLNNELRQSRVGNRKDKSVKNKVIINNEVINESENEEEIFNMDLNLWYNSDDNHSDGNQNEGMNDYYDDNQNNGINDDYDTLHMYGFREDGQYGLLYD